MMSQHAFRRARLAASAQTTLLIFLAAIAGSGNVPGARGQDPKPKQPVPPRKEPAAKFEDVTLTTSDGVFIRCTYYPGPESKQTVPLILVHDWDENRGALHPLAQWL